MAETLDSTGGEFMEVTPTLTPSSTIQQQLDNPINSDSGTDSESDSDSDDEAVEIQNLQTQLSTNPANYDAHVQYIKALRKHGDIDKLHEAREVMSELFPLTPSMWQDWAKDELTLASGSDVFHAVEKIYERGVSDYLSVSLWLDYLKFVQEYDPSIRECSPAGALKARELFERALIAAGLHSAQGSKIWETYIKFEEAIFDNIDKGDVESRKKQLQRIRSIFQRQLSVPQEQMRSTFLTYKAWEAEHGNICDSSSSNIDGIPSHVASAYHKALDMLDARASFEDQISRNDVPDAERLQHFMTYLKFEQSSGDPARVQCLYERALTEFPVSSDLWLDYTHYLNKTLKADRSLKDIFNRAVRNCPWVGELWVRYLLYLERSHASEKELYDVYEKSLLCTFSTLDEYVDIFLTRVDSLRRRILFARELDSAVDYALIRDTFQRASDYLSPQLRNTYTLLRIYSYWARLESSIGKDLTAARGVWESLLKHSGSMLEAWQGYIAMETELGHINEARAIYKRCYSKRFPGTGSEDICNSWIRFEREFGSLEEFDNTLQKATPRLQELQMFRLQQESKTISSSEDLRDNSLKRNVHEKRKPTSDVADEESPGKKQKVVAQTVKKGKDKVQVKKSVEANKKVNAAVEKGKPEIGVESGPNDSGLDKSKEYNDQCTAFISNLNLQAKYEDVRNFFSDVGGVVDIRILMDKYTKKSRGLAYVDFSDDAHLEAAVAKNKQMLLGKRLSIARSDPKGKKKRGFGGHSTSSQHGRADNSKESDEHAEESRETHVQSAEHRRRDENVQLRGSNTFAVPRAVRPLGWISRDKPKTAVADTGIEEAPKSNEEFRNMLLKKT